MTLLRRYLTPSPPRRAHPDAEEADSIADNIQHVLGSHREYASFLPDFGLVEPYQLVVTPQAIELLRQQILHQAVVYEPRLLEPVATALPRGADGAFRFELSGHCPSGKRLRLLIQVSRHQTGSPQLDVRTSR